MTLVSRAIPLHHGIVLFFFFFGGGGGVPCSRLPLSASERLRRSVHGLLELDDVKRGEPGREKRPVPGRILITEIGAEEEEGG